MKNIYELEKKVWELIEIATRERSPEKIAYFNKIASRIENVKKELEEIEKSLDREQNLELETEKNDIIVCKSKDADAKGKYTKDGLIVFAGSKCNLEETKSFDSSGHRRRKTLVEKGILVRDGNTYKFTQNYIFSKPSAAARTVLARTANGWIEWKYKNGKTLDEVIRR